MGPRAHAQPRSIDAFDDAVAALLETPTEVRVEAWRHALAELGGERRVAATTLAHLAPLAASIGRDATLAAAARSVLDVGGWWP